MFNITHGLAKVLDTSSWHIVFVAMQNLQFYFNKKQRKDEDVYENLTTDTNDVSILSDILDKTFSSSHTYDDQMLLEMIDALNTVTLSILEK